MDAALKNLGGISLDHFSLDLYVFILGEPQLLLLVLLLSHAVTSDSLQSFLCIIAVDVAAQKVPNSSVSHASSSMQLVLSFQLFLFFLYPLQLSIILFLGQTFSWSELKSGSESFQRNCLHFLELLSLPGLDIPLRLKVPVH